MPPDSRLLRALLISGTGTGVGKTVVTAALLRALRTRGLAAQAVKPVQTGASPDCALTSPAADAPVYAAAVAGMPSVPELSPAAVLRCFTLPASPHLAAAAEGARLTADSLCDDIRRHWRREKAADMLLLESAGGLCAPLNEEEDARDVAAELDIPVLLVCANRLGALSEFFSVLAALTEKGLPLAGVVMVEGLSGDEAPERSRIVEDNVRMVGKRLTRMGIDVPVLTLPRLPEAASSREPAAWSPAVWERFADMLAPLAPEMSAAPTGGQGGELVRRDRKRLWHPYASVLKPPALHAASRSRRNHIVLEDGRELTDGMSSWWAAVHGYNHPRLLDALRRQAGCMPHVMFGGLTHAPAVELGERLVRLMPSGLSRVFFADSGSVAVEVAMKMALQYQRGRGRARRTRFLAPCGGYHGDTLGAMSVCDPITGMHSLFADALPRQIFMERPSCRFDSPYAPESLDAARNIFETRGEEIAAVILEPVVQGAGGMWFYHPEYLRGLARLCRDAGALLVFDEIATGFGRTGKFFAAEWAGVCPDILCCGKALTGGLLTLAATVCTEDVASGICADGRVFMHGPTFMGNPLACAVALAGLDLFAETPWKARVAGIEEVLTRGLAPCRELPGVADVRVLGAIGVVEMRDPVNVAALQHFFVDRGVWIRPFNNLIYLMPPYVSPPEDVARLCAVVAEAVAGGERRL